MQGRPPLLVNMRIVDGNNRELARDGKAYGDLQVRGPHVISRYFRVRTTSAKAPPLRSHWAQSEPHGWCNQCETCAQHSPAMCQWFVSPQECMRLRS